MKGGGFTVRMLMNAVRDGDFADSGAGATIMFDDGEEAHPSCAKERIFEIARATRDGTNTGFRATGRGTNEEDPDLYCTLCGKRIEPLYE